MVGYIPKNDISSKGKEQRNGAVAWQSIYKHRLEERREVY
jgi:hypothetical protein